MCAVGDWLCAIITMLFAIITIIIIIGIHLTWGLGGQQDVSAVAPHTSCCTGTQSCADVVHMPMAQHLQCAVLQWTSSCLRCAMCDVWLCGSMCMRSKHTHTCTCSHTHMHMESGPLSCSLLCVCALSGCVLLVIDCMPSSFSAGWCSVHGRRSMHNQQLYSQ